MKTGPVGDREQGMVLVVSLLFLVVVSIISIVSVGNSRSALQVSTNSQDTLRSFQAAEAGTYAALATVGTADDVFTEATRLNVFADKSGSEHPLHVLEDGAASVDTDVYLTTAATACPRKVEGFSEGLLICDYYRVESSHAVEKRARTKVNLGVVKTRPQG